MLRFLFVLLAILLPYSAFAASYVTYPKLHSGSNILSLYDSASLDTKETDIYLSLFGNYAFDGHSYYGYLLGYHNDTFGELSISYAEKDNKARLVSSKESAYNISYQYNVNIVTFVLGSNIIDSYHNKAFVITNGFLYSWNIGIKVRADDFILIELASLNLGKKGHSQSSYKLTDYSEYFYGGISLFILDNFFLKFSSHIFKENRIMIATFLSYKINNNFLLEASVTNEPFNFGFALTFKMSFFSIKLAGIRDKHKFYAFISASFFLNSDNKSRYFKGIPLGSKRRSTKGFSKKHAKLVDINKASIEELISLPGIGPAIGKRIVLYRQKNGILYKKSELTNVKGIGSNKLSKLYSLITLGQVDETKLLSRIDRWTMRDFILIGFSPFLSYKLALYIKKEKDLVNVENLLMVEGFNYKEFKILKERLKQYANKGR